MADGELRQLFRQHLIKFDMMAVETGLTALGVPDLNYCHDGCEGWVEMKKVYGRRVRVAPAQVGWSERRLRHGGRVFVAARKRRELWLFSGWALRQLLDSRLEDVKALGHWNHGPAGWGWEEISCFLCPLHKG